MHAPRNRPEDTSHFHAIARPHGVDNVVEGKKCGGMRRLALGDLTRGFLQPHDLSIGKNASVVDELHRALGAAAGPRTF
jgi:hypothetical protein